MTEIHPTAIIDRSAQLGEDVAIGPYCVVGPHVVIGARTRLHNHVILQELTTIGEDNEIFPFSVLGADPQDRKFAGERATSVVGDRNKIREHVTIHRGTRSGGGVTTIGNDNLIMVAAHLAHDCRIGNDVVIANQVMVAGHVMVEDGASIGGGVGIHHFTTIGTSSFVGGMARIAKDVPPYMIVEGNPAEVRAVNTIAMTRRGYEPGHIDAVKEVFKRLFRDNGGPISEKILALRADFAEVPAVERICASLEATADGIHGRALEGARGDDKRAVVV
jgi:UDP-N-acetylglucosamine acyltransferase